MASVPALSFSLIRVYQNTAALYRVGLFYAADKNDGSSAITEGALFGAVYWFRQPSVFRLLTALLLYVQLSIPSTTLLKSSQPTFSGF